MDGPSLRFPHRELCRNGAARTADQRGRRLFLGGRHGGLARVERGLFPSPAPGGTPGATEPGETAAKSGERMVAGEGAVPREGPEVREGEPSRPLSSQVRLGPRDAADQSPATGGRDRQRRRPGPHDRRGPSGIGKDRTGFCCCRGTDAETRAARGDDRPSHAGHHRCHVCPFRGLAGIHSGR